MYDNLVLAVHLVSFLASKMQLYMSECLLSVCDEFEILPSGSLGFPRATQGWTLAGQFKVTGTLKFLETFECSQ